MHDIAKLRAEKAKLESTKKRLREQLNAVDAKYWAIIDAIDAAEIAALVGQQVRIRTRLPAGDRCAKLNDAVGVLESVRRTRGTVDFGEHGKWNFLLAELLPADKAHMQGFTIGGVAR